MIHNFGKTLYPPKKGLSDPQKSEIESPKKSLVSKQPRYVHFAKKQVQFGQFWPQEPHFWSTDAYRGSPPCAIFHNPDNREIYYSDVLESSQSHFIVFSVQPNWKDQKKPAKIKLNISQMGGRGRGAPNWEKFPQYPFFFQREGPLGQTKIQF